MTCNDIGFRLYPFRSMSYAINFSLNDCVVGQPMLSDARIHVSKSPDEPKAKLDIDTPPPPVLTYVLPIRSIRDEKQLTGEITVLSTQTIASVKAKLREQFSAVLTDSAVCSSLLWEVSQRSEYSL